MVFKATRVNVTEGGTVIQQPVSFPDNKVKFQQSAYVAAKNGKPSGRLVSYIHIPTGEQYSEFFPDTE